MPPESRFSKFLARAKVTTVALAERTGYSVPAVKSWRAGTRSPSKGAQHLIANALGIPIKTLRRLL